MASKKRRLLAKYDRKWMNHRVHQHPIRLEEINNRLGAGGKGQNFRHCWYPHVKKAKAC